MAAAAGAPGSGEGGEAEPDSEPISGDDRPRHEHTEASAPHGSIVQELGWEKALHSGEAEHAETGLRLPELEVTDWESEVPGPSAALEVSPEAWPLRRDMEAEAVENGEEAMVTDVPSSQLEEEPMQLGKDSHCPPAPCHGGPAAPDAPEETNGGELTPSLLELPPDPVHFTCAPSPQPQVTSEQSQDAPETAQGVPEEVDVLQEAFPETFALFQDLPGLGLETAPNTETPVQECIPMEEADTQEPRVKIEAALVEESHVPDPVPDVFLQVQETRSEPEVRMAPWTEENQEMATSEPEAVSNLREEALPTDEEDVPELMEEDVHDIVTSLIQEPSNEVPVDADHNCVPEEEEVHEIVASLIQEPCEEIPVDADHNCVPEEEEVHEIVASLIQEPCEEIPVDAENNCVPEEEVHELVASLTQEPCKEVPVDAENNCVPEEEVHELVASLTQEPCKEVPVDAENNCVPEEDVHELVASLTQEPCKEVPVDAENNCVPEEEVHELVASSTQEPCKEVPVDAENNCVPEEDVHELVASLTQEPCKEVPVDAENNCVPEEEVHELVASLTQEPCKEVLVDAENNCVPEPFHEEQQDVEVVEDDQDVHPEPMQCTEVGVEVELLPSALEGSDGPDIHAVSPERECQSNTSPGQASERLIMSDLVPEDVHSLGERKLEDAASPMDSGISSELTSVEKELDSRSSHMETEPNVENSSECTNLMSYSQDVDYDPFYRDTKVEESSNSEADIQEECEVSTAPIDIVQTRDLGELCVEEPTKADVDARVDAPRRDPLSAAERLVTGGIEDLLPGSEVQVTLDHIIQDALVVSFRHGDRIFSGVLMDLSKRFGPHGIPVTLHPQREYRNKPEEPIQPQSTSFQEEESLKNENGTAPVDVAPIQATEPCGVNNNLWTSKPPPLFHEGAPYPPPLFIRDTYNQSIPQPPPRKIKRLKKKIYREEPTSIMNAIKLRPRQVLCDKCKNVVADKREVRKTGNDSFKIEEGKRRRHESVTTVNKKLKTDHKINGKSQSESQKKNPVSKVSTLGHGRGRVVRMASHTNAPKAHLHTKKVLQSKNMDHAKAREVLKMAKEKAQKKQKETSSSKNAHGKVHFTRRLQNTTSGTLPPRLRIKPQRYRNEENDSSLKIGLESLRSSKIGIKPQTRYTATRSAGEVPSEIQTPSNGPEEVSSAMQDTSVCVPPSEQEEQQGSKSNITVYMTLNQKKADSSSASVCSSDSTDDLKSTHSECSSTENFDFPPGSMHAPSSSSSSSSKEEKKLSNSLKIKVFSKNVSKCMTPDGRTICVGDIVWAKIYGFPWWPARILTITVSRKDNGLLVRQEASISWFGSPTTSFLALSQLSPFLENFQSRFNKKRKGLYRKAITEAAKAAKQLTPEVRALLTQFET